jgi:prenyltransferase beta subunit
MGGELLTTRDGLRAAISRRAALATLYKAGAAICLWPARAAFATAPPRPASPWDIEAREYLGTPRSEAAVARGLSYLASSQAADGHWRSGTYDTEVAITGLCLLAFLATGCQPGRGRYGLVVNQAIDFLAASVNMSGAFGPVGLIRSGVEGHPMYGHGFALLALCEAYGMAHRQDLKVKLQAAVKLLEDTQNQDGSTSLDGGWRYQPQPADADISVTVVEVMALRAARNAGIPVSHETLERAMGYIRRCARESGGFAYQVQQSIPALPRSAAAVLSLLMAGMRDTPECRNGLRYLSGYINDLGDQWQPFEHFYYAMYYLTQAMYQAGGAYWRRWYPSVRDHLVSVQESDGSWSRNDRYSEAGVEYATAMSVLVLQVPAGLLPIYQK